MKQCIMCGQELAARQGGRKYCISCRIKRDDELWKQRSEKSKLTKCIKCGKEIKNYNGIKKYCSQCRGIVDREFRRKKVSANE